jgi:hypothetical protein
MPRVQVRLFDIMAFVAFAAIIFSLITFLGRTPFASNRVHETPLAIYVAVLCTSALAARLGRRRWRPFWSGLALFGGVYLVVGLKMGWGVSNRQESASLLFCCQSAFPLGLLCGMATQWLTDPHRSGTDHGRPDGPAGS